MQKQILLLNGASNNIKKLKDEGHKLYIITARWLANKESQKTTGVSEETSKKMRNTVKEWLKQNNITYDYIIFSEEDKSKHIIENNIDIMIEDSPHNLKELSKLTKMICMNWEYNKGIENDNIYRCYNWNEICEKILELEKKMYNDKKIVVFDWGGVVESHFPGENNCYSAKVDIINRLNEQTKTLDEETIRKKWNECVYDENGKCISEVNDKEDIQKWFERIKLKFDLKCDYNEFLAVYKEESDKIKYYKDVVEFAHSLKNKCKIGILSNLAYVDKERINKHYDLSKFDYVWLSFYLECKKPNKKIYDIVVNDCKLNPNNILFIDDKEDNLEIPKRMGWQILQATGHDLDKIKEKVYEFLNKNRSTGN